MNCWGRCRFKRSRRRSRSRHGLHRVISGVGRERVATRKLTPIRRALAPLDLAHRDFLAVRDLGPVGRKYRRVCSIDKSPARRSCWNDGGGVRRVLRLLILAIAAIFRPKALLIAENLCLRQQLVVLQRRHPRACLRFAGASSSLRRGDASPAARMSKDRRGTCARWVAPYLSRCCMTYFCALHRRISRMDVPRG